MTSETCPACGHATLHSHEGFLEQGRKGLRNALIWTCPSCGWQRYEAAPISQADPLGSVPRVWLN
jgi:rRNA maturation protein Nop10